MVIGRQLRDLHFPVECVLVAVLRNSELLLPRGDTVLLAKDEVVAITHDSHLHKLSEMLGPGA